MTHHDAPAYGLWFLVFLNSAVYVRAGATRRPILA
jgi:hypothetical protein